MRHPVIDFLFSFVGHDVLVILLHVSLKRRDCVLLLEFEAVINVQSLVEQNQN